MQLITEPLVTGFEGVLNSYSDYLRLKHPKNAGRFDRARESDPEASIAEALVFQMLQTLGVRPEIHDRVGTGGAAYICYSQRGGSLNQPPGDRFVVEATALSLEAVSERSNIPNEWPKGPGGCAFGVLTKNICNKAKAKNRQLADHPMPRVLAIVSTHFGASLLFDFAAAERALVSDTHWREEIGNCVEDTTQYTDLGQSVFIRLDPDGRVVACRQNISAILLIAANRGEVYGVLHPEPEYPFNIASLAMVPFVRIARWPIVGGRITTEWTREP